MIDNIQPHGKFYDIDISDVHKYCYGTHPKLIQLRTELQVIAERMKSVLEDLRLDEYRDFVSMHASAPVGQMWVLRPLSKEKFDEGEYEDRDWVRFSLIGRHDHVEGIEAHKTRYGPVAEHRRTASKDYFGATSLVYYRLASGKVKSGSGGWHVLKSPNNGFHSSYGVWTDEEWLDFRERGIVPHRFW